MQGTRVQSLAQEDPLEKEVATHSSILAWRIPWTEEPGGLQSIGLQTVGQLTLPLEIPVGYAGVIPSREFRGKGWSGQHVKGTERGGADEMVWGVDGDREEEGRVSRGTPVLRAQR